MLQFNMHCKVKVRDSRTDDKDAGPGPQASNNSFGWFDTAVSLIAVSRLE